MRQLNSSILPSLCHFPSHLRELLLPRDEPDQPAAKEDQPLTDTEVKLEAAQTIDDDKKYQTTTALDLYCIIIGYIMKIPRTLCWLVCSPRHQCWLFSYGPVVAHLPSSVPSLSLSALPVPVFYAILSIINGLAALPSPVLVCLLFGPHVSYMLPLAPVLACLLSLLPSPKFLICLKKQIYCEKKNV